jgi:hypothetical protein
MMWSAMHHRGFSLLTSGASTTNLYQRIQEIQLRARDVKSCVWILIRVQRSTLKWTRLRVNEMLFGELSMDVGIVSQGREGWRRKKTWEKEVFGGREIAE